MKIKTEVRSDEFVTFYKAETIDEIKDVSAICRGQVAPNSGWFNLDTCAYGWVATPRRKSVPYCVMAGSKH